MTHGVDPSVEPMEAPGIDALLHAGPRKPNSQQLPPGYDSMLFGREQSELLVDFLIECVYTTYWIRKSVHAAETRTARVTGGSR